MTYKLEDEDDVVASGIRMWHDELPQLDTSGKEITGRIIRLSEIILERMNGVTHDFGLKYATYAILATLRAGGEPFEMTPKVLQSTLFVSSGGLSNQLARLEQSGLVQRLNDPSDGRGVRVRLTDEGRELVDRIMPVQAGAEVDFIRMLSGEEREVLARLLSRILVLNAARR